ncbi:hypothetical protein LENED_001789 [Lentinula edodes]|uniref:Uncharacterized protein n=1 Tax=Lentinula edodes TaxID=5353 RepID=A0A1Q3DZJ7_LENED|nr:hypothetical protein LENED_001789 [Lentinula edodes]
MAFPARPDRFCSLIQSRNLLGLALPNLIQSLRRRHRIDLSETLSSSFIHHLFVFPGKTPQFVLPFAQKLT